MICESGWNILRIVEVILRRAEAKLKLSKSIMENNELGSGLNTTIETKTQVWCPICNSESNSIVNSFKMYCELVSINY